ncbi:MAG: ribonuclease E/G [Pseudomonadota bacterium]
MIALTPPPVHAALVIDGRVEDILPSPPEGQPHIGAIMSARVDRQISGQNAAFVTLPGALQGYLREAKGLKSGDAVRVMVTGLPEDGKAVPVSHRILLKGRGVILTPGRPGVNVSRQIRDPDLRARLAAAVVQPDDETGVIIRSAAREIDEAALMAECAALSARLAGSDGAATSAHPMLAEALRDWTDPLPEIIACPTELEDHLDWERDPGALHHDPDLADALRFGDGDPFDHFGVWDEIEKLKSPRSDLPSGGWMAIETTRAMVTVDVNTGEQFTGGAGMTANVEAARELPRQLRLRGLGGQVIVDFAPMKKQHRKKIEETLKQAFRRDPIETTLAGWTPLGNFELTRKRERRHLLECL